ncbi:MAG TPA: lipopolysaccharide biosynthesis protein [Phycisphaerae bacterium]|nr:lipopolysaccharide biosynthesis protein [Phycisphaerae bacterium]
MNAISNWIRLIVLAIVGAITIPYLMHQLGDYRFGVYAIVGSAMGFISLLDFGLQTGITRFVAQDEASGDYGRLLSTTSTGFAVKGTIGLVGFMVTVASIPFVRYFFNIPWDLFWGLAALSAFMGLSLLLRSLAITPGAILIGASRFELRTACDIVGNLARLGLLVLFFSLLGPSLGRMGLAFAMGAAVFFLLTYTMARYWIVRRPIFRFSSMSKSAFKRIASFGLLNGVAVLGGLLLNQGLIFTSGKLLGTTAATYLAAPILVAFQLQGLAAGFASPLIPLAGRDAVQGQGRNLGPWSVRISRLTCLLCICFVLPLCILAEPLLRHWLGPDKAWTWTIFVVVVATTTMESIQVANYYLVVGGGKIGAWAASQLVAATVGLGAAVACHLLFGWGLLGIVSVVGAAVVARNLIALPIISCRQFGVPLGKYLWNTYAIPAVAMAVPAGATVAMLLLAYPTSVLMLVLELLASMALLAAFGWLFGLTKDDRRLVLSILPRRPAGSPTAPSAAEPKDDAAAGLKTEGNTGNPSAGQAQ